MRYEIIQKATTAHPCYFVADNETSKHTNVHYSIPKAVEALILGRILNNTTLSDLKLKNSNPEHLRTVYQGDELPTRESHPEFYI